MTVRYLTDKEIVYILDFLYIKNDDPPALKETIKQIINRSKDELLEAVIDVSRIEEFKTQYMETIIGASSLLSANMIRSSHNSVKVVTQSTISSKRGAEGKNALQKKTLMIRQIKSFSDVRSINMIWLHATPGRDVHDLAISLLSIDTSALVKDVRVTKNSSHWDIKKDVECVEIRLHATRLFEFRVSMYDIVTVLKKKFQRSLIYYSLEREGLIHIYDVPEKGRRGKSVASFMGEVQLQLLDLHIKGIKGVTDSYVDEFYATECLSDALRVINGNGYSYRSHVNLAQLISNHMLEEDVVIAFSEEFNDFEYNTTDHYFYFNGIDKEDTTNRLKNVRERLKKSVIVVIHDPISDILDNILIDPRFDQKRSLFNNLHYGYDERGVEYAVQWTNFELKMYAENFEYHTHHPLIERSFALGYPTPITEKGNRERDNGLMAAITFGKGEETLRRAAVEQTHDFNNNVYSSIKIGNPAPFGTNVRLGKHPYVEPYKRIAEDNNIAPYHLSITERVPIPPYVARIEDFTEGLNIPYVVNDTDLTIINSDSFHPEL